MGLVASLHLFAALPGGVVMEFDSNPNPFREELGGALLTVSEGALSVPQGPGLGLRRTRPGCNATCLRSGWCGPDRRTPSAGGGLLPSRRQGGYSLSPQPCSRTPAAPRTRVTDSAASSEMPIRTYSTGS